MIRESGQSSLITESRMAVSNNLELTLYKLNPKNNTTGLMLKTIQIKIQIKTIEKDFSKVYPLLQTTTR